MEPQKNLLNQVLELNLADKPLEVIELLSEQVLEEYNSADLYAEKAVAFIDLEDYESAEKAINRALDIEPNHPRGNYCLGKYNYSKGNYRKAIISYDKAILNGQYDRFVFGEKGNAYYQLSMQVEDADKRSENLNKALELYNKALSIDPEDDVYISNRGWVFIGQGQYDKAIESFNIAREIEPDKPDYLLYIGSAYSSKNDFEKAKEFFQMAIDGNPSEPYYYNHLGNLYFSFYKYNEAIKEYNKAIGLDPEAFVFYNNLGNAYFAKTEYREAEENYKIALEKGPDEFILYYYLGNTYNELAKQSKDSGLIEKAIFNYRKYIELTKINPDNYYFKVSESNIAELEKQLGDLEGYGSLSNLVNQIKEHLFIVDGCITHYTSLSVTKAMVINESDFRLSEGAYLNDTSEGKEMFKYLGFKNYTTNRDETKSEPFSQRPFIGCFVTDDKEDNLTLWRMYGKEEKEEARGCSITLDMSLFLESIEKKVNNPQTENIKDRSSKGVSSKSREEFLFYRVAYINRTANNRVRFIIPGAQKKEKKLNSLLKQLRDEVGKARKNIKPEDEVNIVNKLNTIAYLFKTSEYKHETELRLVINGDGFDKVVNMDFTPPRVYVELAPIKNLITKITLGPKVDRANEWAAAFHYKFIKDGLNPDIHISHLPFK